MLSYLRLDHPNIVKYHATYEDEISFYFVMEFCPKGIFGSGHTIRAFSHSEIKNFMREMAHAMKHYFDRGIVHRDIKPDNVMIGCDGQVRICDFGISKKICSHKPVLTEIKGSSTYMAPEVF
jgi:serine/threonine protein kinase